jgi:phage tail-like protein
MAMSPQTDPLRATNFLVEIDGITRSRFVSVTGLGSEVDVVEEREGTDPRHSHKVAGTTHTQNLVLRWPSDDNTELTDWHQRIREGQPDRRNVSIVLLDETGSARIRWNVIAAWPAKWEGPSLNAESNDIATETIELTHEGITRG